MSVKVRPGVVVDLEGGPVLSIIEHDGILKGLRAGDREPEEAVNISKKHKNGEVYIDVDGGLEYKVINVEEVNSREESSF